MNVRVNLNYPIYDGAEIVFKAPCDASEVTGLILYYPGDAGVVSSVFTFADAHTNDLGNIDALFAAGAVVKVIIDTDTSMAFVQNAVTNAYLEERFAGIGGGGGSSAKDAVLYTEQKLTTKQQEQARQNIRAVATVNNIVPDGNGNVLLFAFEYLYIGEEPEQQIWIFSLDPSTDEWGNECGVLGFSHDNSGLGVILTGVAPGKNNWDAVNVGQLKAALGNYYTKEELEAGTEEMLKGLVSTNLFSEELAVRDKRIASMEENIGDISDTLSRHASSTTSTLQSHDERITALDGTVGNITTALDAIIAMQEELISL